jgi:hypothetical protein
MFEMIEQDINEDAMKSFKFKNKLTHKKDQSMSMSAEEASDGESFMETDKSSKRKFDPKVS